MEDVPSRHKRKLEALVNLTMQMSFAADSKVAKNEDFVAFRVDERLFGGRFWSASRVSLQFVVSTLA